MAVEIKYSAAMKKKLKVFEWSGRGNSNSAVRALKMLAPRCETCQTPEVVKPESPTRYTWMKECQHDPYASARFKALKTPKIVIDEDGDEIVEEVVTRTKVIRMPNVVEIPIGERYQDNEAVEHAIRHGFITMEQGGYAPMCQMYGCGSPWPTVGTDLGNYCTVQHAKLVAADQEGIFLTANNAKLLKQKMREIDV